MIGLTCPRGRLHGETSAQCAADRIHFALFYSVSPNLPTFHDQLFAFLKRVFPDSGSSSYCDLVIPSLPYVIGSRSIHFRFWIPFPLDEISLAPLDQPLPI